MPELHRNQIEWNAPEPQKVSLAKPDYSPVADALGYLSRVSDDVAKTQAAYDDNQLVKSLQDVDKEAEDAFAKEDSLNGNYTRVADEAINKWHKTFDDADEATKNRFLRNNPYAAEEFEISTRAKAEKLRTTQVYNRTKLDISQWSWDVVNAGRGAKTEEERAAIQEQVLKEKRQAVQNLRLPIEMTDDLLFDLQSNIDDYGIATAINNREFEKADKLIREGLPTKGAADKARLMQQLTNEIERAELEKIKEQQALEEAKKEGKDKDSQEILQIHAALLEQDQVYAAEKIRLDYYSGKDIPVFNENGEIDHIIHAADTSPLARDKLYGTMNTSAERAPAKLSYLSQYNVEFNRLSSGLMQKDGSLKLDKDEYVTPAQFVLAKQLKRSVEGYKNLSKEERVFLDNVLRAFGTTEGLDMLDLNPYTRIRAASFFGNNYQKANPVVNYQALLNFYDDPQHAISAALSEDKQLTGREVNTVGYYADKYIDSRFKGDYEMDKGTRPRALATLFTLIATNNNPYGMKDVGLQYVTREKFESDMVEYLENEIRRRGYYEQPADYQTLVDDFKNVYQISTGTKYVEPEGTHPLQKYIVLAMQGSTIDKGAYSDMANKYESDLPRDDALRVLRTAPGTGIMRYTEMDESLRKTDEGVQLQRARQTASSLDKMKVTNFVPPKPYIKQEPDVPEEQRRELQRSKAIKAFLGNSSLTE